MAKEKVNFCCVECGFTSPGWLGKCPQCGEWGSLHEEVKASSSHAAGKARISGGIPSSLAGVIIEKEGRLSSGLGEFDRVLGGGLVKGVCVLMAGDPGIGKSTLLLQVCSHMERKGGPVLYVSGEESETQVKMRAERLGIAGDSLFFMPETNVEAIISQAKKMEPALMVIDSVQTVFTDTLPGMPGTVSQLRESTAILVSYAKKEGLPLILVGHVTKEGAVAGPRLLEHMVDAVIYFEGEKGHPYRVLRSVKNRFGSVSEVGIFEMTGRGLSEVTDPSGIFSGNNHGKVPGMVVYPAVTGSRVMMVEVQALMSQTYLPVPRRVVVGLETNRSQVLAAIVEKHCRVRLGTSDLFLNVTGGLRVNDTGVDLAVIMAILSGAMDTPVPGEMTAFGEVGLGGEVRSVQLFNQRVGEALRMGFKKILVPSSVLHNSERNESGLELIGVDDVRGLKQVLG